MAGLLDDLRGFFSREAGQQRREWLNSQGASVEQFVPPELRGLLGFAAEMTPSATLDRAAQAGGQMMAPGQTPMQRVGNAGRMLSETAGVAAPVMVAGRAGMSGAQALEESLLGFSMAGQGAADAGRRFVADEAGSVDLWHPISGVKLDRPLNEMSFSVDPTGTLQDARTFNPEDLQ